MRCLSWHEMAAAEPDLASHGIERLARAPSYLATVRGDGWPRVHPVGPLSIRDGRLIVPMLPTSPKGADLRRTGRYGLHCGVEDASGGGGELLITGEAIAATAGPRDTDEGWVVFELLVGEMLATRYEGCDARPVRSRWSALTATPHR